MHLIFINAVEIKDVCLSVGPEVPSVYTLSVHSPSYMAVQVQCLFIYQIVQLYKKAIFSPSCCFHVFLFFMKQKTSNYFATIFS